TDELRTSLSELAKLYAAKGLFELAFEHQSKFIEINDAIANDEGSKKINEMEEQIKAKEDEMKKKAHQDQIAMMEKDKVFQEKMLKMSIYIGAFIVLILAGLGVGIYYRYQMKKKAHANLEQKNKIIEE